MEVHIHDATGTPPGIARARAACGLLQMLLFALLLGGAIALFVASEENRWIGYVLGGALLAVELAGWTIGARAIRRTPEFDAKKHLATAPLESPMRGVLAVYLALIVPLAPYVATAALDGGAAAFACAVIAVSWCHILRMWLRRSWLGSSWIPFPVPARPAAG